PIAVGGALIRTLVPIGTHFSAHFELHQGLAENRDGFSKKVGIMHSVLAQKLFKCDAKIGHFRVLLCDVLVLQRMEPESDLFCQDHPLFTPLLGTLTPFVHPCYMEKSASRLSYILLRGLVQKSARTKSPALRVAALEARRVVPSFGAGLSALRPQSAAEKVPKRPRPRPRLLKFRRSACGSFFRRSFYGSFSVLKSRLFSCCASLASAPGQEPRGSKWIACIPSSLAGLMSFSGLSPTKTHSVAGTPSCSSACRKIAGSGF